MRSKRVVEVKYADNYNELAEYVNSKEVAILITGYLYDEIMSKIKTSKRSKLGSGFGKFMMASSIIPGIGIGTFLLGAGITALGTVRDEFRNYDVKIDKESESIELLLKKGPNKYRKEYDELSYY